MNADSFLHNLLAQHKKTDSLLKRIALDSAGWDAHVLNTEQMGGALAFVYVWDQPTDYLWACGLPAADFVSVSQVAHSSPTLQDNIRSGTIGALHEAIDEPNAENVALGLCLIAYAGTTKTWEQVGHLAEGGHFIVLSYRPQGSREATLRPFAIGHRHCRQILARDQLKAQIQAVVAYDQRRHPEWFSPH